MSWTDPNQHLPSDELDDAIKNWCAAANARLDDHTEWDDDHLEHLSRLVSDLRAFQRRIHQ